MSSLHSKLTAVLPQTQVLVALEFRSLKTWFAFVSISSNAGFCGLNTLHVACKLQGNQDHTVMKHSSQFGVQGTHELPNLGFATLN